MAHRTSSAISCSALSSASNTGESYFNQNFSRSPSTPPKSVNISRSIGLQRMASRQQMKVKTASMAAVMDLLPSSFTDYEPEPEMSTSGRVQELHSLEELEALVLANSDKLVVLDCSTKLCGPCKMMDPYYTSFAQHYQEAIFVKIDPEENERTKAIMAYMKVRALPAFFAWRDKKLVGQCRGAQDKQLKKMIVDNVHQGETGYVLPCFRPKTATIRGGGPRSMTATSQQPNTRQWGVNVGAMPTGA